RYGDGLVVDANNLSPRARALYSQAGVFDQLTTFSVETLKSPTIVRETVGWDICTGNFDSVNLLAKLSGRLTRTDLFGLPDLKGELEGGADFFTVEAYTAAGLRARVGLSTPLFG